MEPQEKELHKQTLLAAARNLSRLQHDEIRALRTVKTSRTKWNQALERQSNAHEELHSALEAWYLRNFGLMTLRQELQSVTDQLQSVGDLYQSALQEVMLSCVSGDDEKILQATERFGQLNTQLSHLWTTRMSLQNAWSLASAASHQAMQRRDNAQALYDAATARVKEAQTEFDAAHFALPSTSAESVPLHEAMLRAAMAYAGVPEGPRVFVPIYLHMLDINTVLPGDESKS